ncbi:ATP-dependent nuclease [Listeria monocytogenes]|nr:AAA family ATPase [Listeria monocytogenes]EAD9168671.1 DUF2813 domain-containing protein [Listeria monocytogenes]EAF2179433.1 DUF2813 domain-containing protein [Listeria monocytogenes]EID0920869.1 AAA family ATPase [Listeria monocytogenes]EJO3399375.1 AAA family ATPase [Listeria monocytogenes]EKZ0976707.1 AAA family ATPase [Listeria monocytogenes]
MIFESISIKNFRNFKDIQVTLSNKNVFLGLNNVGKTNFLYAFRFIFDREIRKNNLLDSDFHCKKTDEPIEIVVKIDISDTSCVDSQKLRAKLKGAISSSHDKVFIKLSAEYNKTELLAMPILSWGGDIDNLYEMKQRGYMYDIDYIMNVIYIDSYVDLNKLFKKSIGSLIKNDDNADENIITEIEKTVTSLNSRISSLSGVKSFEERITPEYRKFRDENISVSVKSEIAIKGLYSNIVPYIRTQPDETLYPTSGEGRKKLLVYSIFSLISAEHEEKKINLFLIEEPENHLHKSIQIALSQILFEDNKYNYLFMSTHSPFILYEMNKVNLVRIYNKTKIDSTSEFYTVPQKYGDNKKMLNKGLSEAIFADKVLLVEGPSELILFEKVLSSINPFFESDGIYILPVNGIGFKKYRDILENLKILNTIKTDNDLRIVKKTGDYSALGFSRVNKYIKKQHELPKDSLQNNTIESKRSLYTENKNVLDVIREEYGIYLSKTDLENDLDEVLHDELITYLNTEDPVKYLQEAKNNNMVKLTTHLKKEDCNKIYEHYNFACLKEVLK